MRKREKGKKRKKRKKRNREKEKKEKKKSHAIPGRGASPHSESGKAVLGLSFPSIRHITSCRKGW